MDTRNCCSGCELKFKKMDTRNCCSGCAGVDDVYLCSSPIRRARAHTCIAQPVAAAVKEEESAIRGNAAVEVMQKAVKEESVRVMEAMPKATAFVKKEAVKVNA